MEVRLAPRRDAPALWFFALPLYSYAFHAGMTQNISRFSWPILPEAALALCLLFGAAAARAGLPRVLGYSPEAPRWPRLPDPR